MSIDDDAVERWARAVSPADLAAGGTDLLAHVPGTCEQAANLVLLIEALNFCFWSSNPIHIEWRGRRYERFDAMLVSLSLAARYDSAWFDPEYWLRAEPEEIRQVLCGRGELLLFDERVRIIRETARILLERFDGQFTNAVQSVNHRAWPLAVLLMTNFDSFRDVSRYGNQPVYFMKRAQICALDLSKTREAKGEPAVDGLEELTAFADYRVPQALRHLGILRLEPALAQRIDSGTELPAGGAEEVEIRAATVQAVERMKNALSAFGRPAAAWEIDTYLWNLAHDQGVSANHHRTRTVYY